MPHRRLLRIGQHIYGRRPAIAGLTAWLDFRTIPIMAKRTSKKSPSKKTSGRESKAKTTAPHFTEQMMRGIFDAPADPRFAAQEHAFNAMDAMADQDWETAQREALHAIKIDTNCVDALLVI